MTRDPRLDVPRRSKSDRPVIHWRPRPPRPEPTPRAADRAINTLGWALDFAIDELLHDLNSAAKRRGYESFSTLPSDQVDGLLATYHDKVDGALEAFERAPLKPLCGRRQQGVAFQALQP